MPEPQANGNPQAGEQGANQPQAGNPITPQAGDSNQNQQEPKLTKEEFDRLTKKAHEANNEAKNLRERLRALEGEKEAAETERLKAQGEFKTLAEKSEAELNAVKPRYDRLTELTKARFTAETKDWPKEVKDLLPSGDGVDAVELVEAIEKYKPLVTKLAGVQQQQRQNGQVRSPAPANQQQGPKTAEDYYKEFSTFRPF